MKRKIIVLSVISLLLISSILMFTLNKTEEEKCTSVSIYPNDAKPYHRGNIYEELEEYENSPDFDGYKWEPYGRACKI